MAIRVVEFSSGGTKFERFLHKNQHTQKKLLNFVFLIDGELSKSANFDFQIFSLKNTNLGAHFSY